MRHPLLFTGLLTTCCLAFFACSKKTANFSSEANWPKPLPEIAEPQREFRAAWVATVTNIDWPSKSTLTTEEQKAEAIVILDRLQELNMNAVIWQGRPSGDALYDSKYEPWSFYLTNQQGTAPDPYYDPLEFWIEESHKRGMELHVWFNPYRALHPNQVNRGGEISEDSVVKTHPEVTYKLSNGTYWMDPSSKFVQERSTNVVMDVVKRYDVDGIHFDDYFYPYPSYNDGADFPDDALWKEYVAGGGKLSRGDWRRDSVNTFVRELYKEIKAEKKHVKFGMSPFGIYRPGYPASIQGFDQYAELYADALLWLREGWVDYYTPQLYWSTKQVPQSFPVLLGWWDEQNVLGRNLWPGLAPYKDTESVGTETVNQIMISRGIVSEGPGQVMFSMKTLFDEELGKKLKAGPYAKPALAPTSPWLDDVAPQAPLLAATKDAENLQISITPQGKEEAFRYVLYFKRGSKWDHAILNKDDLTYSLQNGGTRTVTTTKNQGLEVETKEVPVEPISSLAVTAVDRMGNESTKEFLNVQE